MIITTFKIVLMVCIITSVVATISYRVVSLRSRALIRTGRSQFVPHVHSARERLSEEKHRDGQHSSRDRFLVAIQRAAAESRLRELLAHEADVSRETDWSAGSFEEDARFSGSSESEEWAPEVRIAGGHPGHRHSAHYRPPAGLLRELHFRQ